MQWTNKFNREYREFWLKNGFLNIIWHYGNNKSIDAPVLDEGYYFKRIPEKNFGLIIPKKYTDDEYQPIIIMDKTNCDFEIIDRLSDEINDKTIVYHFLVVPIKKIKIIDVHKKIKKFLPHFETWQYQNK